EPSNGASGAYSPCRGRAMCRTTRRPPTSRMSVPRRRSSERCSVRRKTCGQKSSAIPAPGSNRTDSVYEADAAAVSADSVQGVAHEASKNGIRLFLWEKFVGLPDGKPVLLFVHGSSMASQPTFDLAVPGRPDSSAM